MPLDELVEHLDPREKLHLSSLWSSSSSSPYSSNMVDIATLHITLI